MKLSLILHQIIIKNQIQGIMDETELMFGNNYYPNLEPN